MYRNEHHMLPRVDAFSGHSGGQARAQSMPRAVLGLQPSRSGDLLDDPRNRVRGALSRLDSAMVINGVDDRHQPSGCYPGASARIGHVAGGQAQRHTLYDAGAPSWSVLERRTVTPLMLALR